MNILLNQDHNMKFVNSITSDYRQNMDIALENGEQFNLNLYFSHRNLSWFCDINYKNKIINGIKITTNINILNKWKNILPFGILIDSDYDLDPYSIDDFTNGFIMLYILNDAEIKS